MSQNAYHKHLVESEKFLMQLQRNLKDQLNRLKVEEISLLTLISNSSLDSPLLKTDVATKLIPAETIIIDNGDSSEEDMPLSDLKEKIKKNQRESEKNSNELLNVNKMPLNLTTSLTTLNQGECEVEEDDNEEEELDDIA